MKYKKGENIERGRTVNILQKKLSKISYILYLNLCYL